MTLQEVLLDDGRPFCSHYGAVVGLTELGPEVSLRVLLMASFKHTIRFSGEFYFINGVDNVIWPPYGDSKAGVSSISPPSERIWF